MKSSLILINESLQSRLYSTLAQSRPYKAVQMVSTIRFGGIYEQLSTLMYANPNTKLD